MENVHVVVHNKTQFGKMTYTVAKVRIYAFLQTQIKDLFEIPNILHEVEEMIILKAICDALNQQVKIDF